jgi:hypothetical protein
MFRVSRRRGKICNKKGKKARKGLLKMRGADEKGYRQSRKKVSE